jgi:foldase protein PrsA
LKIDDKKIYISAVAVLSALLLTACRNGLPIRPETSDSNAYSDAAAMLVIATERNRYRDVYTDQVWQVQVDADGTTFQEYLLNEIRDFLRELKTINLLADERDLRLNGQEKDQLLALAEQYYDSLTKEDRNYIGADKDDIYDLYEQYYRANKLVDELTGNVDLEISDSDAKMIRVQEIVLSDEAEAQQVCEQASSGSTDFLSLAQAVSENPEIEKTVGRNERPAEYEDVVFSLETGEISPVISMDGSYYIVRVTSDYDEAATQERKEKLMRQRKSLAFRQIYDKFAEEYPVEMDSKIWTASILEKGNDSTTTSFFSMYEEVIGSVK